MLSKKLKVDRFGALVLLCYVLAASTATAQVNVLTNPGFETGDFTGWNPFFSSGGLLLVTATTPHGGSFVADFNTPGSLTESEIMSFQQTFAPVPTDEITELSFWARTETSITSGVGEFRAYYTDDTFSFMNTSQPPLSTWTKFDMTSILTPGKALEKIQILNHGAGPASTNANRDLYDDFQLIVVPNVPTLSGWGLFLLGAFLLAVAFFAVRRVRTGAIGI